MAEGSKLRETLQVYIGKDTEVNKAIDELKEAGISLSVKFRKYILELHKEIVGRG